MTEHSVGQRQPNIPRIPTVGDRGRAATNAVRPPVGPAPAVPRIVATATPMVQSHPTAPAPKAAGPHDEVLGAIRELRTEVQGLKGVRRRYRRSVALAGVAVIASAAVAFAAITGSTTSLAAIFGEGYSANENVFTITSQGALLNVLAVSADGTSQGAAIELAASAGTATEALGAAEWYYQITMAELAIASVASHANYSVTLYQNGTSLGTLYAKQNVFADSSIESIVCRWALGTTLPAAAGYTVKVLSI